MALATSVEPLDGGLAEFMNRTGWVIDLDEFRARPEAYLGFDAPEWLVSIDPTRWRACNRTASALPRWAAA